MDLPVEMPLLTVAHDVLVPSVVKYLPLLLVWLGARALNAVLAVVCPVPPEAIGTGMLIDVSQAVPVDTAIPELG